MIIVKRIENNLVCDSCYRNKQDDDIDVYMISIGFNHRQMFSFKLCKTCFAEANKEVHNQY